MAKFLGTQTLTQFITKVINALNHKVDKVDGMGLSEASFTNAEKTKLHTIQESAERNTINDIEITGGSITMEGTKAKISIQALPDGLSSGYVTTGRQAGSNLGSQATVEGVNNTSSGMYAHAEGYNNTINTGARASHAEGWDNTIGTSAENAHAEGQENTIAANAAASHVEGRYTEASARYAHAQNWGTIAAGEASTAIGRYNASNANMALIIGNGTSSTNRTNAITVDWDGNVTCGTINGIDTSNIYTSANFDYSNLITKTELPINTIATKTDLSNYIEKTDLDVTKVITTDNIEAVIAALPSVDGVLY